MEPHAEFDIEIQEAYASKTPMRARIVAVMDLSMQGRNLELIDTPSRGFHRHEVHQLTLTDDPVLPPTTDVFPEDMRPDGEPDHVARNASVLCFFEVLDSGLVLTGDEFVRNGDVLGDVRGYDVTHHPNHYNVILHAPRRRTGVDVGLEPGEELVIRPRSE
jgi:hypothetical protein